MYIIIILLRMRNVLSAHAQCTFKCLKYWSSGPIFHGKLVHCRTNIFSVGPIFHEKLVPRTKIPWKIGPPDQYFRGPIFQ